MERSEGTFNMESLIQEEKERQKDKNKVEY